MREFGSNRVCKATGIIAKDEAPPCPIDAEGRFTTEIPDFASQFFKEADDNICKALKVRGGHSRTDSLTHSLDSLTYSLIDSLTDSLTYSLTHPPTHCTHALTDSPIH